MNSSQKIGVYKSKSGRVAIRLMNDPLGVYGEMFVCEDGCWHHVGVSDHLDPSLPDWEVMGIVQATLEENDKNEFDLSESMIIISEGML